MNVETENTEELSMAQQAALNKKNRAAKASGEKVEEPPQSELPKGSAPVDEPEETPVEGSVADALGEGEETPAKVEEPEEEPIRIAGKTFKNQKEAFEWAEKAEQDRMLAEAHSQGVREALAANAPPPAVVEEEDFETKFYSNPKQALQEMQQNAIAQAVAQIRGETAKEKAWNEFLSEFPDIRRQDAEQILNANTHTIGALPWDQGRKALASAVYKEYDAITELRKPKTEMTNKKAALSPSGGGGRGVTPSRAEEKPLSFIDQVRKVRK